MQVHPRSCRCYYCYLKSDEWKRERKKAFEKTKTTYCTICKGLGDEYHHFRGYEAIWTENDYKYIVRLCRNCHQRCHYTLSGYKIFLEREVLEKRYKLMKWTYPIRSFRPSTFFNWLGKIYGVGKYRG